MGWGGDRCRHTHTVAWGASCPRIRVAKELAWTPRELRRFKFELEMVTAFFFLSSRSAGQGRRQSFFLVHVHQGASEAILTLTQGAFSYHFFGKNYCSNFQPKIKRTKHDLIINLITRMDGKLRDESIKSN